MLGRTPKLGGMLVVCLLLTLASCNCEQTVRKILTNRSQPNPKGFDDIEESSQPSESEPNDAPEQATLIRLGNELRPVDGEISKTGDVDWFALRTPKTEKPWLVSLSVEPEGDFDPRIEVELEAHRTERSTYDTAKAGETERVDNLEVSNDVRRIAVRGREGTTGAYRLEFKKKLTGGAVEREPNDSRESATLYEFPGEVQGFYGRPEDSDWFQVIRDDAEAGIYRLTVTPTGDFPHRLKLFTGREAEEPYLSAQIPPEESLFVPNVRIPEKIDGLWFLMEAGDSYDPKAGYRLRLVAHPAEENHLLEGEPNNGEKHALGMKLGEVARGYLHTPSDIDRYDLAVGRPLPSEMEADTADGAARDVSTAVAEPEPDTGVDAGRDVGDGGIGSTYVHPIESVPEKTPPAHVVQVGLRPMSKDDRLALVRWPGGEGGRSQKTVATADEPGETVKLCNMPVERALLHLGVRGEQIEERRLKRGFTYELTAVDIAEEVEGLEVEPNGSREKADRLELGVRRAGFISRAEDRDVFAFGIADPRRAEAASGSAGGDAGIEPPEPASVHIELQGNKLNLGFKVLDREGGLIAEVDRGGAGGDEKTDIDLPPGLYFVEVTSKRGFECSPYRLEVQKKGNQ